MKGLIYRLHVPIRGRLAIIPQLPGLGEGCIGICSANGQLTINAFALPGSCQLWIDLYDIFVSRSNGSLESLNAALDRRRALIASRSNFSISSTLGRWAPCG